MGQSPVSTQCSSYQDQPPWHPSVPLTGQTPPSLHTFQRMLSLSPFSPHKPFNTRSSSANMLPWCEGNIYNYPSQFYTLTEFTAIEAIAHKKTSCSFFLTLCPDTFYNERRELYRTGCHDRCCMHVCLCESVAAISHCKSFQTSLAIQYSTTVSEGFHVLWLRSLSWDGCSCSPPHCHLLKQRALG